MGDWRVLSTWNRSADGFHECAFRDDGVTGILFAQCFPVVEQHQADVVTKEPKPLKFTIAVAYQKGVGSVKPPSDMRGWHWSISWFAPLSGKLEMRTGYGYDTKEEAKFDAEAMADTVALINLPEEIYTYTPEVP